MNRFKNILYLAEASIGQDSTIARAVTLAENNQADLTILDVVPPITVDDNLLPGQYTSSDLVEAMLAEHRESLERLVEPYRPRLNIRLNASTGIRHVEAIRAISRDGHDLLIKPAENPSWIERLFGSDDMQLLRKCPCPIWMMKPVETSNYDCILAAVDFDPLQIDSVTASLNREIVELAASLALSDSASLHLVHAWDTPAESLLRRWSDNPAQAVATYVEGERQQHQRGMGQLQAALRERLGPEAYEYLSLRCHSVQGLPKTVIPQFARELSADLVVMGTVGRTGIPGLMIGNTAESILDQLTCSLLALKPPGFVSPVR